MRAARCSAAAHARHAAGPRSQQCCSSCQACSMAMVTAAVQLMPGVQHGHSHSSAAAHARHAAWPRSQQCCSSCQACSMATVTAVLQLMSGLQHGHGHSSALQAQLLPAAPSALVVLTGMHYMFCADPPSAELGWGHISLSISTDNRTRSELRTKSLLN